jgi:hypothetical protein
MDMDWAGLAQLQDIVQKTDRAREVIADCKPGEPLFLSTAVVKRDADSSVVLKELAIEEESSLLSRRDPMIWKILVLKDEWGNVPNPGDKVVKVTPKPLKRGDAVIPIDERNVAMMDGSYKDLYEDRREYIVDEKGCIDCSFTDAVYFLSTRGKHLKSNRPMTTMHEMSTEPVLAPDGNKLHVHYWLYKEMTKESYEKLPLRKVSKDKKRGYIND